MDEYNDRPYKRPKTDSFDHENVTRPDQIHQWLEFQQSIDLNIKNGVNTFKDYLTSVSRSESVAYQSRQYQILKEYCQWQKAATESQIDFYDILSTWSFAVDSNVEAVISAVPAALAQFLKTISGVLELRTYGLALIDSLLRREQSKLFERCLLSPRTKPHLASPCLRLLTEMLSFDAGARSAELWYRRDLFVPKFEAVLEFQSSSESIDERKKPSVRRMALRFLIALLKYLDFSAKTDLLFQSRALHKCLAGLMHDADDVVIDVLNAMNQYLLDDKRIPRGALAKFFSTTHLENLLSLYSFEVGDGETVRAITHKLLVKICNSDKKVFDSSANWLGLGRNHIVSSDDDFIDLGLDSPFESEILQQQPARNGPLSTFAQRLQPHKDSLQSSLLIGIFKNSPDLLPEYFSKKRQAPVAASDDVLWRSYFAFIFAVAELPVPIDIQSVRSTRPPHLDTLADIMVPVSIDKSYLVKMLSSEDEILRISAARLTTVILRKLESIISIFDKARTDVYLWEQAKRRLSEMIKSRLPNVRELNLAVQHNVKGQDCSALLECLLAFHQILPSAAIATSFDISPIVSEICSQLEQNPEQTTTFLERLAICVKIAESTSTKWLSKSNNESLSTFAVLMRATISSQQSQAAKDILSALRDILCDNGIIRDDAAVFAALRTSLTNHKKFLLTEEVLLFMDNCITRASSKPVKYLDDIERASQLVSDKRPLSLLAASIAEQWLFALKKYEKNKSAIKDIAAWITRVFALFDSAGENYRVMNHFQEAMLRDAETKPRGYLQDALDKMRKKPVTIEQGTVPDTEIVNMDVDQKFVEDPLARAATQLEKPVQDDLVFPDSFQGLDKWSNELEIELEITTKRLPRLILCLASTDAEIRVQAFQTLQKVLHIVDSITNYEGKEQVYLILGELCETANQHSAGSQPLPTIIPELANALLEIAVRPTHLLFSKANKFLLHKPHWSPKGVVLYWVEHLLHQPPDGDEVDVWNQEREWLLRLLLRGLRVDLDLQLYRRSAVWEHILSLFSSVSLSLTNKDLILSLLWKAIGLPGGADMLWTRFGVHSWLQAVDADQKSVLDALRARLEQHCSSSSIEGWKLSSSLTKLITSS